MSFISLSDIISVVVCFTESKGLLPEPKIFLCISASTADAAVVKSNGTKTLLANGLATFLLMVMLFLIMAQEVYLEILLIVSS